MDVLKAENVVLKEQIKDDLHEQEKKIWQNTSSIDGLATYVTPE